MCPKEQSYLMAEDSGLRRNDEFYLIYNTKHDKNLKNLCALSYVLVLKNKNHPCLFVSIRGQIKNHPHRTLKMKKLTFTGSNNHTLTARLDTPDGEIRAYARYAHCFTCTKDVFAAGRIATALNALGIAMFRFDFAGLGQSEGNFADTNFTSNVEDLIKAADYMREHLKAPSILIGHSLGGSAETDGWDEVCFSG